MSALETLILGIVQGLTEFLPVSSSGHLELVKPFLEVIMNNNNRACWSPLPSTLQRPSAPFLCSEKTLLILSDLLRFKRGESLNFSLKIILSMVPAVVIGLFFEDFIASLCW